MPNQQHDPERNWRIYRMAEAGHTYKEVALRFRLSMGRVHQICMREAVRLHKLKKATEQRKNQCAAWVDEYKRIMELDREEHKQWN